jgi:hypothetical protein
MRYTSDERLVGTVGVDSGTVIIIDPCYLHDSGTNWAWEAFCEAAGKAGYAPFEFMGGIASGTTWGDGSYPVYAVYNERGALTGLRVDFDPQDPDEDDDSENWDDDPDWVQ